MENDVLYMFAVVAVGFALNFGLRALPFVIFGSRRRVLPIWAQRLGAFVSPVIIMGLIVYSYSGLQWKSAWPYLAGAFTVGLQLWRRNPLTSIVAGTVLYMSLVNCGCTTVQTVKMDARNPAFRLSEKGLYCGDERIMVDDLTDILESNGIPKTRTIHILLEPEVKDLSGAKFLMAYLAKAGYTRPVLVTKQHGESYSTGKKSKAAGFAPPVKPTKRKIRYRSAAE